MKKTMIVLACAAGLSLGACGGGGGGGTQQEEAPPPTGDTTGGETTETTTEGSTYEDTATGTEDQGAGEEGTEDDSY